METRENVSEKPLYIAFLTSYKGWKLDLQAAVSSLVGPFLTSYKGWKQKTGFVIRLI